MRASTFIKVAAISLWCGGALGWNSLGHMMVARIAELQLQASSPDTLAKAYACLSSLNPFFKETPNSLLEAAVMPDYLNFDFGGFLAYYHYTNTPIIYKNDDSSLFHPEPFPFDINFAFKSAVDIIKNSQDPAQQKDATVKNGLMDSLMLRYLIHITGDSHQPLHASTLFSSTLLDGTIVAGDKGGNLIPVNDVFGINLNHLHTLWDAAVGQFDEIKELPLSQSNFDLVDMKAKLLVSEFPLSYFSDDVKIIDMEKWIAESFRYAQEFVYQDIDVFPLLTPQYILTGQKLCRRRLALSGYRLAEILKVVFAPRKAGESAI